MTIASVQNVSFRYPGYEHWILKDFSLELYDREVLAIIGKSGCGKSTLMWGTKNGPLGLVEKGLKSSTF